MGISILVNDDRYLDLFEEEFVGLGYQVFDLKNLESRQGTFSNDFKIPNTAHNRAALGNSVDENVLQSTLSVYKKIPAKAYQNNILISDGFIQILEVVDSSSKEIDITFFGDNIDVFELIRGKKLSDLGSSLSYLRHAYTAANIVDSFSNTSGYIYPVIDYGEFTDSASMTIAEGQIFAAIFASDILRAIFKDAGYKIDGTLLKRALYKKSIVPFTNYTFGYSQDFVNSKNFFADNGSGTFTIASGATVKHDFTRLVTDYLGTTYDGDLFSLSSDRYTSDSDYKITISYSYDYRALTNLNASAFSYPTIEIRKNGVAIATESSTHTVKTETTLTAGDYIEFYVTNNDASAIIFGGNGIGNVQRTYVTGSIIYPETVLPDMTQVDFLKWVLFRFAGVMTTDKFTKTVYFNQFNDIKNNAAEDWSSKIDLSKEIKTKFSDLSGSFAMINIAKYKVDDNDPQQKQYNADNNYPFGSGVFSIDNDFLEDEKTIYESVFSATISIDSFSTNNLLIPYIPRVLSGSTDTNVPEPRVLTNYGAIDIRQFSSATSITILGTPVTEIPFTYFYKSTLGFEADDFKESLAFGVQNVFAPNDLGAFDSDYLTIISIIRNQELKMAYIKLNQVDIVNRDFLKKKYLERFGGYFYLNLIDEYDGSGESVKCELIKIQ